jgi:hypothetical protein
MSFPSFLRYADKDAGETIFSDKEGTKGVLTKVDIQSRGLIMC